MCDPAVANCCLPGMMAMIGWEGQLHLWVHHLQTRNLARLWSSHHIPRAYFLHTTVPQPNPPCPSHTSLPGFFTSRLSPLLIFLLCYPSTPSRCTISPALLHSPPHQFTTSFHPLLERRIQTTCHLLWPSLCSEPRPCSFGKTQQETAFHSCSQTSDRTSILPLKAGETRSESCI